jgi:hypothetical protein
MMQYRTSFAALTCLIVSTATFFSCKDATSPAPAPTPSGMVFRTKSLPLPGFEGTVDAITKASDILDTLYVRIDSLPQSDSLKDLVIDWGDLSAVKTVTGARFPAGATYVGLTHWYTRESDSLTGMCTTTATATSWGGIVKDTTLHIKVLRKTEHQ